MLIKDINEILSLKTEVVDLNKDAIIHHLKDELSKFNFDDAYTNEGDLLIDSCKKIQYFTAKLENFTETRNINESGYPNSDGIPLGKRSKSEYNVWDYILKNDYNFIDHEKNFEIEESHHAVGCTSCKQKGRIRCYKCSGNGDLKCDDCSGRGEVSCRSCNGNGETSCWSCFGRGTVKKGFGDNERTVNCSGCGGRGNNPCSSCRGGYINCSYCSGRGRKSCYVCDGSREVDCDECDGYKSIDHWFVVNSKYKTNYEKLFLTLPLVGFDLNIAKTNNILLEKIVLEQAESSFSKNYFSNIYALASYNRIVDYFDFKNTNQTKLISSRISIYQNTYIEVKFSFYQENYILYLDDTFKNSYYSSKKPSDQYELDLLNKFLTNITNNDLVTAKRTVQKLSEYKYININEALLAQQISVTEAIYEANDEIKNRNYTTGEKILEGIKDLKGHSDDFRKLKSKLNKIYFKNTSISALFLLSFIIYKLLDKNNQFLLVNATIASAILVTSYFLNYLFRNIHTARFVVLILFSCQAMYIFSEEKQNGTKLNSESYIKKKYIQYDKKRAYQDSIFKQMGIFKGSDFLLLEESKNKPKTSENLYLLARIYTKRAFDSILIYTSSEFNQDNYINNYDIKTGSSISLKREEFSTKSKVILFNESVNLSDSFINEALKIDPYDDYFIRLKCYNITHAAGSYPLIDSAFLQKNLNDYFDYLLKFYHVIIRDEDNPSNLRLLYDIMSSSMYKNNIDIINYFRGNDEMYRNLFRIYYKSITNLEKFYKNNDFMLKVLKNEKLFWLNDFIRCGVDVN
jgi:hypothetical protein